MSDLNLSRAPPPRSILKNRDGSRFSNQGESGNGDDRQNNMMNNPGTASWMNSSGNMVASGVNPSPGGGGNPIGGDMGLDRSLRHKLNEFISRKADMLFKPLTPDEMPLAEVKGTQHNTEDHYGVVPSLDHYLRVDTSEIRRYFFQNLQVGDVLIASVASRNNSGLFLKLMSTEGGKHIVLEDLGIKCFCPLSQTIPAGDTRDTSRSFEFQNGDLVRVEALEVSADTEKLVCGMKGVTLSPEMQHSFHLGLITRHDLPRQFTLAKADGESRNRKNYQEMLITSSGFQNPNNVSHLASTMGILSDRNSLMVGLRGVFPSKESAYQLRRIQNAKWAHGNVAEGIKYFKMEKFTEAFQCLNKALSIDAENVEGLVARGALYANNGGFEKAIDDFESALKFNPNHFNARKYLAETLVALGRQQEETGKLEDAVASYSKCLVVKPDHKDAKEALWSLYERTNKLDVSKLAPPASIKAAELKEKLKAILQSELGMKIDGKGGKEKKSKKKKSKKTSSGSEEDSSSSSTSESDSDSSSSDESDRGKRKKKRKKSKKSKKSKKGSEKRKSRDESKNRALSLSPFSKRLVDPQGAAGSGLAGFSESTFAEWGQQLGISKPDQKKDESDDESKKSAKKSKDKKRSKKKDKRKKRKRATSSSSTSESESSREKDRKKSKNASAAVSQNTSSIDAIIPDLGDLEAKLSAYYSKIEQEKIEAVIPPEAVKITVERSSANNRSQHPRDAYNEPVRKIEVKPKVEEIHERQQHQPPALGGWNEAKQLGKIELRTDDYGNYIQPENIVRTVHNDTSTMEQKPIKFEMKFKNTALAATGQTDTQGQSSELGSSNSKWRPLGSAPPPGSMDDVKEISPVKAAIKNPFEVQRSSDPKGKGEDRNYRNRKPSRSQSPRSRDRRRRRSYSRSRSNSSSSNSSRSRSRSRSRSPYRGGDRIRKNPRFDRGGDRSDRRDLRGGRAPVRFFRGFNRGSRRPYVPRGRFRPNGPSRSKFRNRFSNSMSRSRSRERRSASRSLLSRSRSKSVERIRDRRESNDDRDRSRRDSTKDKQKESPEKRGHDSSKPSDTRLDEKSAVVEEIQIGSLTTTKASDVEELLDKRNAEKKEELRKSNPDFFRN